MKRLPVTAAVCVAIVLSGLGRAHSASLTDMKWISPEGGTNKFVDVPPLPPPDVQPPLPLPGPYLIDGGGTHNSKEAQQTVVMPMLFSCPGAGKNADYLLQATVAYKQSGKLDGATLAGTMNRCTDKELVRKCHLDPIYQAPFTGAVHEGFGGATIEISFKMPIWDKTKPCKEIRQDPKAQTIHLTEWVDTPGIIPLPDLPKKSGDDDVGNILGGGNACPSSVDVGQGVKNKIWTQDGPPVVQHGCEMTTWPTWPTQ